MGFTLVDLAQEINAQMPSYVVTRLTDVPGCSGVHRASRRSNTGRGPVLQPGRRESVDPGQQIRIERGIDPHRPAHRSSSR